MKNFLTRDRVLTILMLFTAFICMLTFALIQPFGDGPDEINRFKIVDFIYHYGKLPLGDDPEVLIDGYGASYAFQPYLTFIIDGFLLRFFSFLAPSLTARVFISRLVNIGFGLAMALYVKHISNLLFSNKKTAWAFTLAVVFLPQNLFLHSYVNTDSMGFLSIAMIIYAILKGFKEDFSLSSILHLSIGIIFCALSYYNCYGIILCAIIAFFFYHLFSANPSADAKNRRFFFRWSPFFKKGLFISSIVLIGISWWFIRNALLYEGDFLALTARQLSAARTSTPEFNPFTRDTYQKLGVPIYHMIFKTDYFSLVWRSFIAMFGPMAIPTHHYIYLVFRDCFFLSVIGLLLPLKQKASALLGYTKKEKLLINFVMLLGILIPGFLAIYYSYTWEFQPQGRYYHPMLIPFMYFLAIGIEKIIGFFTKITVFPILHIGLDNKETASKIISFGFYVLLYSFFILSLIYSVFIAFLNYYH